MLRRVYYNQEKSHYYCSILVFFCKFTPEYTNGQPFYIIE